MRTRFHRLLLLFLTLALPLQAFASAAMLDCAFAPAAEMEQVVLADDAMDGCHDSGQPEAPPVAHDCTHCSACALGAVLPIPSGDSMAIPPLAAGFTAHPAAAYSGFVPDGPERPPRPLLA